MRMCSVYNLNMLFKWNMNISYHLVLYIPYSIIKKTKIVVRVFILCRLYALHVQSLIQILALHIVKISVF